MVRKLLLVLVLLLPVVLAQPLGVWHLTYEPYGTPYSGSQVYPLHVVSGLQYDVYFLSTDKSYGLHHKWGRVLKNGGVAWSWYAGNVGFGGKKSYSVYTYTPAFDQYRVAIAPGSGAVAFWAWFDSFSQDRVVVFNSSNGAQLKCWYHSGQFYASSGAWGGDGYVFQLWYDSPANAVGVAKLNATGNVVWAVNINVSSSIRHYVPETQGVAVDKDGNIYTGWMVPLAVDNGAVYVAKLDKNGNVLWVKQFNQQAYVAGAPYLTVDPLGNVYVAFLFESTFGTVTGTGGMNVLKLDPNGNLVWSKYYTVSNHEHGIPTSLAFFDDLYVVIDDYMSNGTYARLVARINATSGDVLSTLEPSDKIWPYRSDYPSMLRIAYNPFGLAVESGYNSATIALGVDYPATDNMGFFKASKKALFVSNWAVTPTVPAFKVTSLSVIDYPCSTSENWGKYTNTTTVPPTTVQGTKLYVTVKSEAGGTTDPSPGTYQVYYLDTFTVTGKPYPGFMFSLFKFDNGTSYKTNPLSFIVARNTTVTATFQAIGKVCKVVVVAGEGGTTDPVPGAYQVACNSIFKVTAKPNPGFSFAKWADDKGNLYLNPSLSVVVTRDMTLTATFTTLTEPVQPAPEAQPAPKPSLTSQVVDFVVYVWNIILYILVNYWWLLLLVVVAILTVYSVSKKRGGIRIG